jgi:KUP system potassium uptake protein
MRGVASADQSERLHGPGNTRVLAMIIGALGVVFGDIGTSPLYTFHECLLQATGGKPVNVQPDDVYGALSLIFWSLTMVVTVKYMFFIMRADNKGEGGIFALLALVPLKLRSPPMAPLSIVAILVVVGASFLYGDGAITPAISVLSAVEGIVVAKPNLAAWVVPITVVVLVGLFSIQSRGTSLIGKLFGPIMIVWFVTLAALGVYHVAMNPSVLRALSPTYGLAYFIDHGLPGILILGSVFLAVTGGEALYADMGHFGARPIKRAWLFLVMPSLVVSYFGQGALVLRDPEAADNPFFHMVPNGTATFALVVLAGVATVIASQAMISGSYSLTRQAMQLGFFPRVTIKHTAGDQEGQIYIPEINWFLAIACIILVLTFRESTRLAAAYGIAVTCTMTITSLIYALVLVTNRKWPVWRAGLVLLMFLSFDVPFLLANATKIKDGGYVPLLLGGAVVLIMLVWHHGRYLVARVYSTRYSSFDDAWATISQKVAQRVGGVGVFMASSDQGVPPILVHLVERTRSLHKIILLLTVVTKESPVVENKDRISVEEIGHGFWRVHLHYGFMQQPNVPKALDLAVRRRVLDVDLDEVTYYLARERILANPGGEMGVVLESMFGFLSRNAVNADRYFRIPHSQVIEVGAQIDL